MEIVKAVILEKQLDNNINDIHKTHTLRAD